MFLSVFGDDLNLRDDEVGWYKEFNWMIREGVRERMLANQGILRRGSLYHKERWGSQFEG